MLIFIYGDDTFRVQEKAVQMRDAFRDKFDPTGLNTAEFLDGKFVPGDILGAARALPFLGEKRMVIIRDLVSSIKKVEMGVWVDGLSSIPDSTVVVFWETIAPKMLEKKPLFTALRNVMEVHDYAYPQLQGTQLSSWIMSQVRTHKGEIEADAVRALIERVGADLWQMDHEINKLVAFASGQKITRVMVDELVHANFEGKIFDMIDAISQKRPERALKLLREERWSGANDHLLLTMLGRQVRILLGARALLDVDSQVSKQEVADALKIHPFVAQKALAQARGFSLSALKNVHEHLFRFDKEIKSSQIDADLAVDLTTVKLMQK